jgi:hypothetical protein
MFLVYPQLPRAGLGNMLLVWARAVLFADINSIPVIAPNWGQIRIGTYLRGERDKRYYGNLFCNKTYLSKINYLFGIATKKKVYHNPAISKLDLSNLELKEIGNYLFIFDNIPHWSDYFIDLKEYQPFIKQRLLSSIRNSVLKSIDNRPVPQIGIHIRMGDFKVLKPGDDFTKLGNVRTPMTWYVRVIDAIREIAGYEVPVTLFSDGHDRELCELLNLPHVSRSPSDSALADMLTLSKSKLLITSSGSTFSGWASYLGQCPTIWHPAHFHAGVFSHNISRTVFEGGFDPESMTVPDLLIDNIRAAF